MQVWGHWKLRKGNFEEINYVVNFESYFGKQICDFSSYMPRIEFKGDMDKLWEMSTCGDMEVACYKI